MAETVEKRALTIAAEILVQAGCCRHDDSAKCRRYEPNDVVCTSCIKRWLLNKARKELGHG